MKDLQSVAGKRRADGWLKRRVANLGGGGGGSTNITVPPQIGQIGQTGQQLGQFESQFLGTPLSIGNYFSSLATGGQAPEFGGGSSGFGSNAGIGTGMGEPIQTFGTGMGGPLVTGSPNGAGGMNFSSGGPQFVEAPTGPQQAMQQGLYLNTPTGQDQWYSANQYGAATPQELINDVNQQFGGGGSQNLQEVTVNQQGQQGGMGGGTPFANAGAPGGQVGPTSPGAITGIPNPATNFKAFAWWYSQNLNTPIWVNGQQTTPGALGRHRLNGLVQKGLVYTSQAPGTQGGIATQNPIYGPFLNQAIAGMQGEAGQIPGMEQTIGQLGGITDFAQKQAGYDINQEQAILNNPDQASLMKGNLLPSQQAYIDAAVKSGQAGIQQQLASEGMGSSTLGPELNAEIGLQGAATAGQLAQGNIQLGQANISLAQAWGHASQAWEGLATGATALTMQQQQSIASLFGTITQQGAGMQEQLWSQAMQGYGLEGQFLNQTLAPYKLSLDSYNSILQASEAQAQINEQQNAASMQETASIIGSVLSMVGSVAGGVLGCWVARMVIPERWTEFREWLILSAPSWFRNFYIDHGEAISDYISNKPILKKIIRWIFLGILKYA